MVPGAGHMLHAEAPRRFHALLEEFAAPLLGAPAPA
jgi:pimeloyl-ACP methyl ester carboxylesterase